MTTRRFVLLTATLAALNTYAFAQQAHWEGVIQMKQELRFTVDLAKNAKGEWTGSIGIPDGGLVDAPLSAISVKDAAVKFSLIGMPHAPWFEGKLSEDGNGLAGDAISDQGSVPFQLKRNGEASVKLPPPSTPVSKELEGNWEGALKIPDGRQFRVAMKLSRGDGGLAAGMLVSVDEGGQEFLLISIVQKEKQLQLRTLRGKYSGTVNDSGSEIAGEYTSGGANFPLVFKRPADPKNGQ